MTAHHQVPELLCPLPLALTPGLIAAGVRPSSSKPRKASDQLSERRSRSASATRTRSLLAGTLIVLALALILLAASVTSGATDWLEIAVALTLLVAAHLLRRNARRTSVYPRTPDDENFLADSSVRLSASLRMA